MPSDSPGDISATSFPVSAKGVIFFGHEVVLLENERNEWELPGGKVEPGEQPGACVVREIEEELGIRVAVADILDSWLYNIQGKVEVVIISYLCIPLAPREALRCSQEHKRMALFLPAALAGMNLPGGYHASIRRAALRLSA